MVIVQVNLCFKCFNVVIFCDFFHCSACAFNMCLLNYLLTYLLTYLLKPSLASSLLIVSQSALIINQFVITWQVKTLHVCSDTVLPRLLGVHPVMFIFSKPSSSAPSSSSSSSWTCLPSNVYHSVSHSWTTDSHRLISTGLFTRRLNYCTSLTLLPRGLFYSPDAWTTACLWLFYHVDWSVHQRLNYCMSLTLLPRGLFYSPDAWTTARLWLFYHVDWSVHQTLELLHVFDAASTTWIVLFTRRLK